MGCGQEKKINHYCEFIDRKQLDHETYSLDFISQDLLEWKEGDHGMLILNVEGELVGKKLSFASLPSENVIRFTTRITSDPSDFKNTLLGLVKGEFVKISEPSGNYLLRREDRPIFILTNGVGIASARPLIKCFEQLQDGIPELIQLNVDRRSDIYKDEFDTIKKHIKTFSSFYVSNRNAFKSMFSHELSIRMRRYQVKPIFYIFGSDEFVYQTQDLIKDLEFEESSIVIGGQQTDSCCR